MTVNLISQLGEWNPQLFRELKGRLKLRNIAIAGVLSVFSQLVFVFSFLQRLPLRGSSWHRYCTGEQASDAHDYRYRCLTDLYGHPQFNWQFWWTHFCPALFSSGKICRYSVDFC